MIRFLIIFLLLSGCDPGPTLKCDYCHVSREGAKRYVCDKCKMTHSACDADKAVMHYSESGVWRGQASYSATGLLTCPSPEDPNHAEIYVATDEPKTYSIVVVAGALLCGFFMGFNMRPRNRDKVLKS